MGDTIASTQNPTFKPETWESSFVSPLGAAVSITFLFLVVSTLYLFYRVYFKDEG